jgi:hypothetical protein
MYLVTLIAGLLCGCFLPHAPVYARITYFFIKCMGERDKKINEQRRQIILLKLQLIKKNTHE